MGDFSNKKRKKRCKPTGKRAVTRVAWIAYLYNVHKSRQHNLFQSPSLTSIIQPSNIIIPLVVMGQFGCGNAILGVIIVPTADGRCRLLLLLVLLRCLANGLGIYASGHHSWHKVLHVRISVCCVIACSIFKSY